ncbi:phosphatidic acid phosphatase type 2/haloperoxidase [Sphaerosporella brunnea]|uniref:Phosphatidic acid phosphatase type 2/haloperoxidase n=1 Tax=Sphaerosporella brunnea TaxID=1250544 RepID=A0A5J5EQI9_9PEZI|nr:phosphatidic acid phosphatase type 2/haloperoxidase [Sphaerosporella brunnea]
MGPFSRRRADPATTTNGRGHGHHHGEKRAAATDYHINRRPTFGMWLRTVWLDILTMAALGAVGLGVYQAAPAPTRSFPIVFQDQEIVYPQFAYPLRKNIIPIWLAALLASVVPIFIILCLQIRIRSFWDANNAILGLLYSLINAAVFQVFLKWLIGGLRPHFLAVCKPRTTGMLQGNGFREVMFTRTVCTGDEKEINDSLESFPSGHSTAAFAGLIFLSLYLNAKLKVFSNYAPHMWKLTALYTPVLGATLIAGSLTIDEYHNWYDVVAGAIIGTMFAFSAYRMMYAAVWDFRFNHVPLPRGNVGTGFWYGLGEGEEGWGTAVATRNAGWGGGAGKMGGAPGDAVGAGVMGAGVGTGTHGGGGVFRGENVV